MGCLDFSEKSYQGSQFPYSLWGLVLLFSHWFLLPTYLCLCMCTKALRAHLPEFYSLTFHVNALVLFLVLALFFEILFFTAWGRKDCWRTTKMKVDPSIWQVSQAGEHRIDNSRAWIFGVLILCEGWDILQLSLRYAGWRIMHIVLEYF